MSKLFALASLACLCTAPVYANDAILNANNLIDVDAVSQNLNYRENYDSVQTGALYDTEHGNQAGIALSTSSQTYVMGIADVYAKAWLQYTNGKTNYSGGQLGGAVQYTSKTYDNTLDLGYRLGKGLVFDARALQLTPYLSYDYHRWGRSIQNGVYNNQTLYGGDETYSHSSISLGLLGQWAVTDRLVLSADGSYGTAFASTMSAGNTQDTYALGNHHLTSVAFGADYALNRNLHLNASYSVTQSNYGSSALQSDGSLEPNSTTRLGVASIGVGYAF
jgi:hypothetical protein